MKIYKIAQSKEYLLENGMLYDEDADDVFSMKELIAFKVPLFKDATEANTFLENIEQKTGKKYGRVPEKNYMKELRYKDTRKEKEEERLKELDERNKEWAKGNI